MDFFLIHLLVCLLLLSCFFQAIVFHRVVVVVFVCLFVCLLLFFHDLEISM